MPDPPPGHRARPEEAQCYNCGGSGHWAIACPEPTRETPAGLTAWRNANNVGRSNSRDQQGGSKKPKGPIITKYAPPPAPGPNVNSYGPPPGYGQPPAPYSGPAPPYPPQYPPHSSSIPSYPVYPSYPPQPYPPSYRGGPPPAHPLAPPPAPPGVYNPPSHPHPLHLPGAAPSYPPPYVPPPSQSSQPPQPYGTPAPYVTTYPPFSYNSHSPPFPASYPPPTAPPKFGIPSGSRQGPSPGPTPSRPPPHPSSGSPPLPRQGKSQSVSTLPHPSLPPKPPRNNRDLPEPPRDHRNKRKRERHNRNRDNRQRKNSSHSRPREQKGDDASCQHNLKAAEPQTSKPEVSAQTKDEGLPEDEIGEAGEVPEAIYRKTEDLTDHQSIDSKRPDEAPNENPDIDEVNWEDKILLKEPESHHPPDEVGKPLPTDYSEEVLLPRKWKSKCIDSEYVKPDNLDEYIKPVHETDYWISIEFDPAFARDGKLPCGDPLPILPLENDELDRVKDIESQDVDEKRQKHGDSRDESSDEQSHKQPSSSRLFTSEASQKDDGLSEITHDTFGHRGRKRHRSQDSELPGADLSDTGHQLSHDRKRRTDHRQSRSRSVSSARSAISNASSGLDSLEAELLGRSVKSKSPDDSGKRHQPGTIKAKKRQTKLDSAYSRRW